LIYVNVPFARGATVKFMAIYTMQSVDHGNNVWHVENMECTSDKEAMAEAERRHGLAPIGAGFDLYRGAALIHRYRVRTLE